MSVKDYDIKGWQKEIISSIKLINKNRNTDTQMKFYKVVARPTLLYGSETWVSTERDMTRLEAAEMRFIRRVKGYTRLDKIRSEVIRKELDISGIQNVRSKYKQKWINHLERMDNTRLPRNALTYKPRGRSRGTPRKRWQRIDTGTGQAT
jgi:hypothetical protein